MKAMTKQQLALCAGISVRTLSKWCRPYKKELETLGMTSHMKLLPPHIVGCTRHDKPHEAPAATHRRLDMQQVLHRCGLTL